MCLKPLSQGWFTKANPNLQLSIRTSITIRATQIVGMTGHSNNSIRYSKDFWEAYFNLKSDTENHLMQFSWRTITCLTHIWANSFSLESTTIWEFSGNNSTHFCLSFESMAFCIPFICTFCIQLLGSKKIVWITTTQLLSTVKTERQFKIETKIKNCIDTILERNWNVYLREPFRHFRYGIYASYGFLTCACVHVCVHTQINS